MARTYPVTVPPLDPPYDELRGKPLSSPEVPTSLLRQMLGWKKEKYVEGARKELERRQGLDTEEASSSTLPLSTRRTLERVIDLLKVLLEE